MAQYAAIAAIGCILGFALSFVCKGLLLENIRLYMGESDNSYSALLFGIIGVLLVFLAIMAYVSGVLGRFRKISAAEAIRFGVSRDKTSGAKRFSLSGNRLLNTNVFLGVKDVLARKRLYGTMFAVLVLSVFIIIVPQNLHNTISSKGFIKHMGIGYSHIRMDIQQTDDISDKAAEIVKTMSNDGAISKYAVLATKIFEAKTEDGTEERLNIELGDHSVFPIEYAEGNAPAAEDEIALSVINAGELNKKVGDTVTLVIEGKEKELTVSGIYSDITNGGKTAKAVFADSLASAMRYVIVAELENPALIDSKVAEYANRFAYAKVSNIDDYVAQTYGSTISSVGKASNSAIAVALAITVLVTLLFIKMMIAKDKYSIAVMKAFGFTNSDIRAQYVSRSVFVLIAGIVVGTWLANTLGEGLAGAVISSFGASAFRLSVNPFSVYVLNPLMLTGAVLIATIIGTSGAGRIQISEHIKE